MSFLVWSSVRTAYVHESGFLSRFLILMAAALKVASYLPFPYSTLSGLLVVPVSIRDAVYDYVAKHRYGWFGKSTECILPTDDVLERFVDKLEIQERMMHEQAEEENNK